MFSGCRSLRSLPSVCDIQEMKPSQGLEQSLSMEICFSGLIMKGRRDKNFQSHFRELKGRIFRV